MRAEIVFRNGRWYAQIVEGDEILYMSKAEQRAGCAARVALNYMEQMHGRPGTDTFTIDLDEW